MRQRGPAHSTCPIACCLALTLVSLIPTRALGQEGEREAGELEIEAELVELDRDTGAASFQGAVSLSHDGLELHCDRLTARVDDDGHLVALEATGHVRIQAAGVRASAGSASYVPGARRVILRGGARVVGSVGTLRGRQIVVDLETGRISIEEVRGVFRVR